MRWLGFFHVSRWRVCGTVLAALATMPLQAAEAIAMDSCPARVTVETVRACDQLGESLARQHRLTEALQVLNRALKLAPDDPSLHHHVALAYAWNGRYADAEREFRLILDRNPDNAEFRIDYGETLAWDRRYDDAQAQYDHVLKRDPAHVDALRHFGQLLAWQGRYDDGLQLLGHAGELAPDNRQVLANRGEILSWKGELVEALKCYRRILELAPGDAAALTRIGYIEGWRGNDGDAAEAFRKAIAADPMMLEAHVGLIELAIENHRFHEAERALRTARDLFPREPRLSEQQASLSAQRMPSPFDITETVEPLIYVAILVATYWHLRRYRRVLERRHRFVLFVSYGLPLVAVIVMSGYAALGVDIVPRRDAEQVREILEVLSLLALISVIFLLVWLMRFGQPRQDRSVLAIGAHPDDIEFGCGATLAKLREEGARTYGLILSRGEMGLAQAGDDGTQQRIREAHASAAVLALMDIQVCQFPDTQFAAHAGELRQAIEEQITRLKPDIIFTHNASDAHSDHRTVFEATREAARGAQTILCYENPNTPSDFRPLYYVDVGNYLDDKIDALAAHKSQAAKHYCNPEVVRNAAGFRGTQARVKYAEAFEVLRILEKSQLA